MLISVLGFGSIWSRRVAREPRNPGALRAPGCGVLQHHRRPGWTEDSEPAARLRRRAVQRQQWIASRSCVPDGVQGVRCEPPCTWDGHKRVSLQELASAARKAGCVSGDGQNEQTGGIKDQAGEWLHPEARLISFSECGRDQEVLLVMPAFSWVRGALGHSFSNRWRKTVGSAAGVVGMKRA